MKENGVYPKQEKNGGPENLLIKSFTKRASLRLRASLQQQKNEDKQNPKNWEKG